MIKLSRIIDNDGNRINSEDTKEKSITWNDLWSIRRRSSLGITTTRYVENYQTFIEFWQFYWTQSQGSYNDSSYFFKLQTGKSTKRYVQIFHVLTLRNTTVYFVLGLQITTLPVLHSDSTHKGIACENLLWRDFWRVCDRLVRPCLHAPKWCPGIQQ